MKIVCILLDLCTLIALSLPHQTNNKHKLKTKDMRAFNRVEFRMKCTNIYGLYMIIATYKGYRIITSTNDSEAFDHWNDDTNKELHQSAKRHCYYKIVEAYELDKNLEVLVKS